MKYIIPFLVALPFALLSQENSGCTDSSYQEYSYLANTDDGSCQTLINCESDCNLTGDINCNGTLDGTDAFLISQWIVGLYNLPCEQSMTGLNPDQLQEIVDLMEGQLNINYIGNSISGFDVSYPDGFDGAESVIFEPLSSYIVPSGKNLYVFEGSALSYVDSENNQYDVWIQSNEGNQEVNMPIIFTEGDELFIPLVNNPPLGSSGTTKGFLVDKKVDVVHVTSEYTVPENKIYCVNRWNYPGGIAFPLTHYKFFFPGEVIQNTSLLRLISGYLIDQNSSSNQTNISNSQNNNSNNNTLMYTIDGF